MGIGNIHSFDPRTGTGLIMPAEGSRLINLDLTALTRSPDRSPRIPVHHQLVVYETVQRDGVTFAERVTLLG